jgi:hypothetical protein
MFGSLKSSYLCLEVWSHYIYVWKFEVVIFMSWSLRSYDDLKLPSINMMTSSFKTLIWRPQAGRHKYDDLKLPNINITTSNFKTKYDDLKLPNINMMTSNFHHIYVWKFEVIIFMFGSSRSSYLCLEVWGHHIYVWKFEVVIFCLEVWGRHINVLKFEVIIFMFSKYKYDDLKLPKINMTTSNFKT